MFWSCLTIAFSILENVVGMSIYEVRVGDTAKLPCPSNDGNHRFLYWQINDDIIGPWNDWKGQWFKCEVTTGELTIKDVSSEQSGLYKCVSRPLKGSRLQVEEVQLLVKANQELDYDEATINTYKGLIAFFSFLIILLLGVLIFIIAKRKTSRGNLEENDDSPDELLTPSRGACRPTTSCFPFSGRRAKGSSNETLTDDIVETDINGFLSLPRYG